LNISKVFCNPIIAERVKEETIPDIFHLGIPFFTSDLLKENQILLQYEKDGRILWKLYTLS
jgi:hypothetical protein